MRASLNIVGANAERARNHNRQMVLGRIRTAGRIGRAEIARDSGLSIQAVSNIIADLEREDLIEEVGRRSGSRGLPAVQYGLNPKGGFAVGIEIRPDVVFATVLDLCGQARAFTRRPLASQDLPVVTQTVQEVSQAVTQEAGDVAERVLGAGIVMPGPFEPTGLEGAASELPIWQEVAPADWFGQALGLPVIVENDANAAAMAEHVSGVAKGLRSYAFLYFGKGLGLGIVHEGRLMTGGFGNAGEIGHIPVPSHRGMVRLEDAVSRLAIQRHMGHGSADLLDVETLTDAYEAGDAALFKWLADSVTPLSAAVTILENILDPETIILGGAMPDVLLDHLLGGLVLAEQSVSRRAQRDVPRLMRGASGRMTATLGAAALVLNRAFTPKIAAVP